MSFDANLCAQYVESLVHQDEVERALLVLDNVPAYYRDNLPSNLAKLKRDIKAALCTTHAYLTSGLDAQVRPEDSVALLRNLVRGQILEKEVLQYNKDGKIPHIVDIGPGEYFAPLGLKRLGYQFTYWDIVVDSNTQRVAHPMLIEHRQNIGKENQPQIFLALEIIEHLPSTQDLAVECLRHCGTWPERIHLSTPQYTYDTKDKDWRKPCGLPHLRAYTPNEFYLEAMTLFPGYTWQMYSSQIMSLRGVKIDRMNFVDPNENILAA